MDRYLCPAGKSGSAECQSDRGKRKSPLSRILNYTNKIICLELHINAYGMNGDLLSTFFSNSLSHVFPRVQRLFIRLEESPTTHGLSAKWSFPALRHLTLGCRQEMIQNCYDPGRLTSLELFSSSFSTQRIPQSNLQAFRDIRYLTITGPLRLEITAPMVLPNVIQLTMLGPIGWEARCPLSLPNLEELSFNATSSECDKMLYSCTLDCPKKPHVTLRVLEIHSIRRLLRALAYFAAPAPSVMLEVQDVSGVDWHGSNPMACAIRWRGAYLVTLTGRPLGACANPSWTLELLHPYARLGNEDDSTSLFKLIAQSFQAHDLITELHTLTLRNCIFCRGRSWESWVPVFQYMTSLRTLVIEGAPVAEIFLALQHKNLKTVKYKPWSSDKDSEGALLPAPEHVALQGIDCSEGRGLSIDPLVRADRNLDLRFLEFVLAYLYGRDKPLELFEMKGCCNINPAEVEVIRRLVTRVEGDANAVLADECEEAD
ncbi:hypothetical protein B0H19DRAFT_659074 [Mycena capillaripes]|nr:hypothetical protein B0H19DRAFT_659074 [Mycena capillaripes]